ncbi:MAG: TetR/AcrR family transcriptional regulator, partial [Bacteroidota bacterium]
MGIQERKEREKEHRREEILNAAQRVFFEKGLQTATMDEIAEVAELSKGTLYLYYKSKEDLYLAVMIRGLEILYNMFAQTTSTKEPTIVQLVKLGDAYYE